MNVFTYLYSQLYLSLKKGSQFPAIRFQVSRFKVFAMLIALQLLNVASLFPGLGQSFRPEVNKMDIEGIVILVVISIVVPVLNYILIDFSEAEKRAIDDSSKVSWKFLLYVIASMVLFALRPGFFIY